MGHPNAFLIILVLQQQGMRLAYWNVEQLCYCLKLVQSTKFSEFFLFIFYLVQLIFSTPKHFWLMVSSLISNNYPFQLIRNGCSQDTIFKIGSNFGVKFGKWNSQFLNFLLIVLRFLPNFGIIGALNVPFYCPCY